MAEFVIRETTRGRHLQQYPLVVLGADFNEAPRARTRDTLLAFQSTPGVHTAVVHADITNPDVYNETVRDLGLRIRDSATGEARPLELKDLTHSFMFLLHNRRLVVRSVPEAYEILRNRIRALGRPARGPGIDQGHGPRR
jgi:hypothetical protein